MRTFFILLITVFASVQSAFAHPVHVSMTNIELSDSGIVVMVQIPEHDYHHIEEFIMSQENITKEVSADKESLLIAYIKKNVLLESEGETAKLKFKMKEESDLGKIFIFKDKSFSSPQKVSVSITLFFDMYPDQKNMVIVKAKGKETGLELTPQSPVKIFAQ